MIRGACALLLFVVGAVLAGCDGGRPDLVLYSSVDSHLLRQIVDEFESQTGLTVAVQGDTELTKTTGLMQRLLDEKEAPRADVWWSSEPFASIKLAREGVLEPYTSEAAEDDFPGGWPEQFRADDGTWYGFARRARVICYNPDLIDEEDVPRMIAELALPQWKGKVGIANPRFGTTRGHMAAIAGADGPDALAAWLIAMKINEVVFFRSNSAVARAVAYERVPLGLTDTDDVWMIQREGYPIEFVYERQVPEPGEVIGPGGRGPLILPNTIGLVRGGPNPENAKRFIDFALSAEVERLMAKSDSHNIPVHPEVAADFPQYAIENPWIPDYEEAANAMDEAMHIFAEVFEGF